MFISISWLLVVVATATVSGQKPPLSNVVMTWQGTPEAAKSSISNSFTTLIYNNPQKQGAQFLYTLGSTSNYPLVTVQLVDTLRPESVPRVLQTGFDIIKQRCVCYWLDAAELVQLFPDLLTGNGYTVRMVAPTGEMVQSGLFGIVTQNSAPTVSTVKSTPPLETAAVTSDASHASLQGAAVGFVSAVLIALFIL